MGYVDSTQLFLRKMQLSASLRSVDIRKPDIRKQIAVLEQQIATAKTEQQRQENLVRAKAGNQKQLDDIVNNIKYLQKQLDAQYSSLSKTTGGADAEAEGLQYQIMQLDRSTDEKPYPQSPDRYGIGEIRRAGRGDGGRQTALQDRRYGLALSPRYVTADQLSHLKLGQSLKVFADYGNDRREYPGTITWISDKSEFTPKGIQTKDERANLVYAIKIAVRNDGYLKIGQYGEIKYE